MKDDHNTEALVFFVLARLSALEGRVFGEWAWTIVALAIIASDLWLWRRRREVERMQRKLERVRKAS